MATLAQAAGRQLDARAIPARNEADLVRGLESPEFYELEREAIFKRAWLNVGRVEDLPRKGSYFTKELEAAGTSIVVVRGSDGQVRAFHNICRHRGNKLVWRDYPRRETSGTCRQFTCKYHGWRYDLDGALAFVQQESEFFDLDKNDYGLVPVHCDTWSGFVFVNVAKTPRQSLREFLGPMITALEGYPFDADDGTLRVPRRQPEQLEAVRRRLPGVLPRAGPASAAGSSGAAHAEMPRFEGAHYQLDGPHRMTSTGGARRWTMPEHMYPIERATRSGLLGPWTTPDPADLPRGGEPRQGGAVGDRQLPDLPERRDPDLRRLVPLLPLLADVA